MELIKQKEGYGEEVAFISVATDLIRDVTLIIPEESPEALRLLFPLAYWPRLPPWGRVNLLYLSSAKEESDDNDDWCCLQKAILQTSAEPCTEF